MRLHLTGLKAIGLRCAEIDIDLSAGDPARFTFLQMPNGTGKTTLADCLRAVLSGEASTWDADHVRSLQRRGGVGSSGHFEARFLLDGQPLAVGLNFDFLDATCTYYTTHSPRGRKPKHDLPPPLGRFADPDFVRLYVFDAELPQQLLKHSSSRADQAIDAFYQLYVLGQMSTALEEHFKRAVDEARASTAQGLTRAENRLEELRTRRDELRGQRDRWKARLIEIREDIADKNDRLESRLAEITQYREQKTEAQAALSQAQVGLDSGLAVAFERLQKPLDAYPESRIALDGLAEALDSLRLPEATSRQFFHELTQQTACICDRPMDEAARAAVMRAADALLQDEAAGVVNALKDDVRRLSRDHVCESPANHAATLTLLLETRDRAATRLEQLRDEASAEADSAAQALHAELVDLRRSERALVIQIEEIEREPRPDDDDGGQCLKWFEQQVDRAARRVADITRTVTLRERKNALQRMLDMARDLAAAAAREDLVAATNERLEDLLPGEDVRVSEIGPSLRLDNREALNLGAMLSVGYAFLTTLFQRGNHYFPFVVDAPSMGLDGIAREALAELLPSVTHQFVGFVLDNERDFVRAVRAADPHHCTFYTIFSDTSRNKPLAEQAIGVQCGPGGTYVVEGYDFFDSVQWTARSEGGNDA